MKKITAFAALIMLGASSAFAGTTSPNPELPASFVPFIILGFAGLTLWLRNFFSKK